MRYLEENEAMKTKTSDPEGNEAEENIDNNVRDQPGEYQQQWQRQCNPYQRIPYRNS